MPPSSFYRTPFPRKVNIAKIKIKSKRKSPSNLCFSYLIDEDRKMKSLFNWLLTRKDVKTEKERKKKKKPSLDLNQLYFAINSLTIVSAAFTGEFPLPPKNLMAS
jgi:hypothetical protein